MTAVRLRRGVGFGAALVAMALVTACGSGGSDSSGGGSGDSGGTVKLGHLAEMTGGGASVGIPQANAIQLAVDQVNEAGGFEVAGKKYTFDMQTEDDKSDATAGVAAVQKIRTGGAKFMVGTTSSAVLGAYLPIVKDDKEFINIIVGAAQVGVTDNISIYRPRVTLDQYTKATISYLKTKNVKKMAMLTDAQHAGYVAETPRYKSELQGIGLSVSAEESWKLGATDFSAQLTSAIRSAPEVLNLRGFPADIARAVKQARELGWKGPIITNTGLSKKEITDAQAAAAMTDVVDIVAPQTSDLLTSPDFGEAAKSFTAAYEAKFKSPPGFTSASAYTGVNILVAALQKAGTVTDIPKIRAALDELKATDVKGLVDAVRPTSDGRIFDKHQASYQMVVRGYSSTLGDFEATEFISGT